MTEEMLTFIHETAERLKTQDNRCTNLPVYVVFDKEIITGMDTQWADDDQIVWYTSDAEVGYFIGDREWKVYERYYRWFGKEPNDMSRTGFIVKKRFRVACLTEAAANDYIRRNGHNLREPYVYVETGYRNNEWEKLRNLLMNLPEYLKEKHER